MADPKRRATDRPQAEMRDTDPALRQRAQGSGARAAALARLAQKANAWKPHEVGETEREPR